MPNINLYQCIVIRLINILGQSPPTAGKDYVAMMGSSGQDSVWADKFRIGFCWSNEGTDNLEWDRGTLLYLLEKVIIFHPSEWAKTDLVKKGLILSSLTVGQKSPSWENAHFAFSEFLFSLKFCNWGRLKTSVNDEISSPHCINGVCVSSILWTRQIMFWPILIKTWDCERPSPPW